MDSLEANLRYDCFTIVTNKHKEFRSDSDRHRHVDAAPGKILFFKSKHREKKQIFKKDNVNNEVRC